MLHYLLKVRLCDWPEQALETQVSNMKKCLKCPGPHSCCTACPQPALRASWGAPYSQLTEEERLQGWFIGDCARHARANQKSTAQHCSLLWVISEGQWLEEMSPVCRTSSTSPACACGRRTGQICNWISSHWFGWIVRDLEGT